MVSQGLARRRRSPSPESKSAHQRANNVPIKGLTPLGRVKAFLMQALNDLVSAQIRLGKVFKTLTQLRVVAELRPFGHWATEVCLTNRASHPMNANLHLFTLSFNGHHDGLNHLANNLFALSGCGGLSGPEPGQGMGELTNGSLLLG